MPRPKLSTKRKNLILDFITIKRGTVAEAAEHFGMSQSHIYRIKTEHEKDLKSAEPVKKRPPEKDDITVNGPKKLGCKCVVCLRPFYLRTVPFTNDPVDNISLYMCSQACHEALKAGKRHPLGMCGCPEELKELNIGRMLAVVEKRKQDFAFKKPELKYMEMADNVNDISDLIED